MKGPKAFKDNFSDKKDVTISLPILHKSVVRANRCALLTFY